jgi:hypothetical protein
LNVYNDTRKLEELPENLKKFYGSILMRTSSYLNHYESFIETDTQNQNKIQKMNYEIMKSLYETDGGEWEFIKYISKTNKE